MNCKISDSKVKHNISLNNVLYSRFVFGNIKTYILWCHILETHIAEFLDSTPDNNGLFFRSEQAFESTHRDFREEIKKGSYCL